MTGDDQRDLEDGVRCLLATAAPTPPTDLDPAGIRRRAGARRDPYRSRWRGLSAPVLACAAVLVLVVALWSMAVARTHDGSRDGAVGGGSVPAPTTSANSGGTARERTIAVADRLLAALPVVPGTRETTEGRPKALAGPPSTPVSPDLVDRTRSWVGAGDVASAEAYVREHLPPGFRLSGTESFATFYDPGRRWREPGVFDQLTVLISIAETDGRVAIRADVQAIWLPSRTPSQHLPLTVTGVSIDYVPSTDVGRMGAPRVRVERGAATARRLARAIDALPTGAPGIANCPAAFDDATTMVFHGPGPDRRVVYRVSGCRGVTLGHGPGLATDDAFLTAYRQAIRGG